MMNSSLWYPLSLGIRSCLKPNSLAWFPRISTRVAIRVSNMKFIVTMFQDEDGMYIAECPAIPGCVSQGETEQEAEKNIQEAIKECLEVRVEKSLANLTLLC
jgi:predicted RNase H-like HicB family nuclease